MVLHHRLRSQIDPFREERSAMRCRRRFQPQLGIRRNQCARECRLGEGILSAKVAHEDIVMFALGVHEGPLVEEPLLDVEKHWTRACVELDRTLGLEVE